MPVKVSSFKWSPGGGPDLEALRRMEDAFPKPKNPMGEAWFMGERRMFPELLGSLDELENEQIWTPLEELASGPSCFGQREEWTEWFHYLLPRLMQRVWRPSVYNPVELLLTCFFAQHPDSDGALPYPDFRNDALATLGQYPMSSSFWDSGAVDIERCFHKYEMVGGSRGWYNCGGALSASLFFCLKYLPGERVAPWFETVLRIKNPYWLEQVIVWLIGAHRILTTSSGQPASFPELGPYNVSWDWSHALSGNYSGSFEEPRIGIAFIPEANRRALLEVVRNWDVEPFFEDFLTDPNLDAVVAETPGLSDRFYELYGRRVRKS